MNIPFFPSPSVSGRQELKQLLTLPQQTVLRQRIAAALEPDSHMPTEDGYRISSLYLDDAVDSAYYEKLAGAPHRRKYRFRWYGHSPDLIMLECKEKRGSRIFKRSVRVDADCLTAFIGGDLSPLDRLDDPLCRETASLAREKFLSPRVIVRYTRRAYCHDLSETRITFDTDLTADADLSHLFGEALSEIPVYTSDGGILEIKYNEYLPKTVAQLLTCHGAALAASKYVLCRDAAKL